MTSCRPAQQSSLSEWIHAVFLNLGHSNVLNHGKTLLRPNRNPTYSRHYFVAILVLTIIGEKNPSMGLGLHGGGMTQFLWVMIEMFGKLAFIWGPKKTSSTSDLSVSPRVLATQMWYGTVDERNKAF